MQATATPWTVEQTSPAVATIRVDIESIVDWSFWVLLSSDQHWDNPHCNREMWERHLNQAKERNAPVLAFGDLFCMMQGKYDKRSSKDCVRPEHNTATYLDTVIEDCVERHRPWVDQFAVVGDGNHETSIKGRHETDPIDRFTSGMRRNGSSVVRGGYTGWVRFMFNRGSHRMSRRLWYIHGYGGGGPVTKDMIQRNRQLACIDGADIMVSGHTHDAWANEDIAMRLNDAGAVERRSIWYVKCPSYKDEYGVGEGGWHVETGKPPKPLGAWWLKFSMPSRREGIVTEVVKAG
ncbi:MAG: hypothetical protein AAGI54_04090 [Planctomycetota bacterium]